MIYVIHDHKVVLNVLDEKGNTFAIETKHTIALTLLQLANLYPEEKLVWCHKDVFSALNKEQLHTILHHNGMMVSFNPLLEEFFGKEIGYVDATLFININKKVSFPTWQMSGVVGITSAQVILHIAPVFFKQNNFNYFLCSVAKSYMPLSLFCYSNPELLLGKGSLASVKATRKELFRFVKEQYKPQWIFFLMLNTLLYNRKLLFVSGLRALFFYHRISKLAPLGVSVQSHRKVIDKKEIDVIIPTIGRRDYLYNVLQDLKKQTILPQKVIIVEQNPLADSGSELDYLTTEDWPFIIDHTFTHTTGACNARNLALSKVTSEWVFMNDDDNRFDADLIEKVFAKINQYGTKVATTCYVQPNEKKVFLHNFQASFFGSGNSFVKSELLNKVAYNMALEFGYGEDMEYGLQLRNIGEDVVYFEGLVIDHLKAPRGGFRTKFVHPWEKDAVLPKPSPTVMYVLKKFSTEQQLHSYKTTLAIKFYKDQDIKNVISYLKEFNKRWKASLQWANQLDQKRYDEV